jgi:hypothetical protein
VHGTSYSPKSLLFFNMVPIACVPRYTQCIETLVQTVRTAPTPYIIPHRRTGSLVVVYGFCDFVMGYLYYNILSFIFNCRTNNVCESYNHRWNKINNSARHGVWMTITQMRRYVDIVQYGKSLDLCPHGFTISYVTRQVVQLRYRTVLYGTGTYLH